MNKEIITHNFFVEPGNICLTDKNIVLYSVAGSGVVVTIYDKKRKVGGMTHFYKPKRPNKNIISAAYALPAISGLLNLMKKEGSQLENLEAQIFGGSENSKHPNHIFGLGEQNIKIAYQILNQKQVLISGADIGSFRGRKIMFNSFTGETMVAKMNKIREKDWCL